MMRKFTNISQLGRSFSTTQKSVIYNWGLGTKGQLGHERFDKEGTFFSGDVYIQLEPRRLVNSSRIQKIACGVGYNIGLTSDQKLLVWGQNYPGNLKPEELMTPKFLEVDFDAVDVSAGNTHCAAVDTKGKVYTWGNNGGAMGGGGQLGLGSYDKVFTPKQVMALNDSVISSVSCGELHTLFFDRKNGQVWCCGANEYGRLGGGPNWGHQDALVPQLLVDSFAGEKVAEVCAGFNHSIALTESGRIFAWGRNDQGQLGLGDSFIDIYSMEDMPRLIESEKLANQKVTQISAGKGTSAALTQEGKIFYWGHKIMHEPLEVPYSHQEFSKRPIKVKVCGDSAKGGTVVCWITEDGELHIYGPYTSNLRGKVDPNASWLAFGRNKDSTLVDFGENSEMGRRIVYDIFGGFGQHMAARVSPRQEVTN